MNRRPFRRHRGGRPLARKQFVWGNFLASTEEGFGTVAKTIVDFATWNNAWVGNANNNATLMRVRGHIAMNVLVTATVPRAPVFAYIGVSDAGETIESAGTVQAYNDEDILWRWVGYACGDTFSLEPGDDNSLGTTMLEVDIKAKRKLKTDSVLNLVFTTALSNWQSHVSLGALVQVG